LFAAIKSSEKTPGNKKRQKTRFSLERPERFKGSEQLTYDVKGH